jgi:hypothetical protein
MATTNRFGFLLAWIGRGSGISTLRSFAIIRFPSTYFDALLCTGINLYELFVGCFSWTGRGMNLHLTITSNCWFARDLEQ